MSGKKPVAEPSSPKAASPAPKSDVAAQIEENFAASVARICQIYGVPAKYGRLYTILFLNPQPMSLGELAQRSGAAKSTTSTALRRLERYRFVRRRARASDRKDYYEVVGDPATILRDWVRMFLAPELAEGAAMSENLEGNIETYAQSAGFSAPERERLLERARRFKAALGQGEMLLSHLLVLTNPAAKT